MPVGHRYWKAYGFASWGSAALSLSEFALYDSADVRQDGAASLTTSAPPISGVLANLQDGSVATSATWVAGAFSAPGFKLIWDFGVPTEVAYFAVGSGASKASFVEGVSFAWSDDGIVWRTVFTAQGIGYPGANALTTVAKDPFWSSTLLQVRFEDDTSTPIDDAQGRSPVINGAMTLHSDTLAGRQGYLSSPGAGNNGFVVPITTTDDPLNLSTGDFTIEFWMYDEIPSDYTTAYGILDWGGGFNYAWPSIRLYAFGSVDTQLYLRSAGYTGDGGDIANGVPLGLPRPVRQWCHYALTRNGSLFTLWFNGSSVFSVNSSLAIRTSAGLSGVNLGSTGYDARTGKPSFGIAASFDDFRVTAACRYTTSFTPPTKLYALGHPVEGAALRRTIRVGELDVFADDPASGSAGTTPLSTLQSLRDLDFAGRGTIAGTVKRDSDPTDVPLRRRVRLHRERDGLLVRETWSDAATGAYSFTEIDEATKYTVITYDYEHNYRAVIADNIASEIMS